MKNLRWELQIRRAVGAVQPEPQYQSEAWYGVDSAEACAVLREADMLYYRNMLSMRSQILDYRLQMTAGAVLFFIVTSFFSFQLRNPYSGPDEVAQAFFINHYATTGTLRAVEPMNQFAEDIIHPRSMFVVQHDLAPGTFLGLILLYGWIVWLVGAWILPLLTPLFATLSAVAFYFIVQKIFSARIARWSFFLLLIHPAWVYYTSRSLFSANVLFLSVLMLGAALLMMKYERWWAWPISGLIVGTALIIRTTEVVWVLGPFIVIALYYRHAISARSLFLFLLGVILPFFPVLYYQSVIYGHPLATGYAHGNADLLPAVSPWRFSSPILATLAALLLPFGIRPQVLFENAYDYLVILAWWFTIPAILGAVHVLRHRETKVLWFLGFFVFIIVWLSIYYGSYFFRDSPLPPPTIGTSYVRYWMPVYVFSIPFVVLAMQRIVQRWTRIMTTSAIVIFSLALAFVASQESLWSIMQWTQEQRIHASTVLSIVPEHGVILTERTDKLFFPKRKVIYYDARGQLQVERLLARVADHAPVYYYSTLTEDAMQHLNSRRLAPYGVAWEDGKKMGALTLYTLQKR